MEQNHSRQTDDLQSVRELAEAYSMGESTAWLLIKRYRLPRYRLPGRGKTTMIRRADFDRAYNTPIPVEDRETTGKAAA